MSASGKKPRLDGPSKCFNGVEFNQLGWFSHRTIKVEAQLAAQTVEIAAFPHSNKRDQELPLLIAIEGGAYLVYNRAQGFNNETMIFRDMVTVSMPNEIDGGTTILGGIHPSEPDLMLQNFGQEARPLWIRACEERKGDKDIPDSMVISFGFTHHLCETAEKPMNPKTQATTPFATEKTTTLPTTTEGIVGTTILPTTTRSTLPTTNQVTSTTPGRPGNLILFPTVKTPASGIATSGTMSTTRTDASTVGTTPIVTSTSMATTFPPETPEIPNLSTLGTTPTITTFGTATTSMQATSSSTPFTGATVTFATTSQVSSQPESPSFGSAQIPKPPFWVSTGSTPSLPSSTVQSPSQGGNDVEEEREKEEIKTMPGRRHPMLNGGGKNGQTDGEQVPSTTEATPIDVYVWDKTHSDECPPTGSLLFGVLDDETNGVVPIRCDKISSAEDRTRWCTQINLLKNDSSEHVYQVCQSQCSARCVRG